MVITMQACAHDTIDLSVLPESSAVVRQRVRAAIKRRQDRERSVTGSSQPTHVAARLERSAVNSVQAAVTAFGLSRRARHRVVEVARTIADLDASETVSDVHVGEALAYRGSRALSP